MLNSCRQLLIASATDVCAALSSIIVKCPCSQMLNEARRKTFSACNFFIAVALLRIWICLVLHCTIVRSSWVLIVIDCSTVASFAIVLSRCYCLSLVNLSYVSRSKLLWCSLKHASTHDNWNEFSHILQCLLNHICLSLVANYHESQVLIFTAY